MEILRLSLIELLLIFKLNSWKQLFYSASLTYFFKSYDWMSLPTKNIDEGNFQAEKKAIFSGQ
jgi:hypothetical protein